MKGTNCYILYDSPKKWALSINLKMSISWHCRTFYNREVYSIARAAISKALSATDRRRPLGLCSNRPISPGLKGLFGQHTFRYVNMVTGISLSLGVANFQETARDESSNISFALYVYVYESSSALSVTAIARTVPESQTDEINTEWNVTAP